MIRVKDRAIWILMMAWILLSPRLFTLAQRNNETDVEKYTREAKKAMAAQNLPLAAAALEKLSKLTPEVSQVHANLGLVYYMQKRYPQAVSAFEKAARIDPGLPNVNALLGICLTDAGRYEDAVRPLTMAFHSSKDEQMGRIVGLDLLSTYKALHNYQQADEVAADLLRRYPHDGEVLYNSSRLFGEQSLNLINQLIKVAPNSAWVPLVFAQINQDEGNYSSAITEYRQALKIDPNLPGVHLSLGRTLLLISHSPESTDAALQEFENELEVDPRSAGAEYEVGEIYRKRAQFREALEHFRRATEFQPNFVEAQIAVGRTLIEFRRPKDAIPYLSNSIHLAPTNAVPHFLLATAYGQIGDHAGQERELALFNKYHVRLYQSGTKNKYQLPRALTSPEVTPQTLGSGANSKP
jgi:tetratricopeptide (TPR) repeat protein